LSDVLYVEAAASRVRGARVVFEQIVRRAAVDGEVLCRGLAEVASMGISLGQPKRLPPELLSELQ
jgi:acyl-CoA thioesterase FadM